MKRILVVDDDEDLVQLVKLTLVPKGYIVKGIYDGDEIQKSIKRFSPDLILLDVFLGEHNGIDICKEIKENPNTKDIKIIIFSTHNRNNEAINDCYAAGFILKPFTPSQLLLKIELSW